VITSTPTYQVKGGKPYYYAVQASDADGDPLTYSLTTFPTGMIQHLQPSESFFRSCGSPTRNNNLFTTIGAEKTKGFAFSHAHYAPWICAGLLLIAPFRSLVAFVVPMELRFIHGDTFHPWRYVFIHRGKFIRIERVFEECPD